MNKTISFNGTDYKCRVVEHNEEELVIAPTSLLDALQPNPATEEDEEFANEEASNIYDEIFYFTDEETLELSDEELVEELKEENPDFFED